MLNLIDNCVIITMYEKFTFIGDCCMLNKNYIECGKIINTHGCRGGMKVEPWCNDESDFLEFDRVFLKNGTEFNEYKILKASVFKQFIILELDGVDDMDKAIALKNRTLYASRADFSLDEGEFFIADMIGLDVIDADSNEVYGSLKEIINRGASDIYVVNTPSGDVMIPAVDEFIISIDIEKGVYVRPIEGMFN